MSEAEQGIPGVRMPYLAKFTEGARQSMYFAQEEARDLNHDYIGTEHLLLGMLREGKGIAAVALNEMGVLLEVVRHALIIITPPGEARPTGVIGLTLRARKVMELAAKEARGLGDRLLGTDYLLLGLLQEGEGLGAAILVNLGHELAQVRAQVLRTRDRLGVGYENGTPGTRSTVVSCRLDDRALDALDKLVEAGIKNTRSEAAAWLIAEGIAARGDLFQRVNDTVRQIRELRAQAQSLAEETAPPHPPAPSPSADGEGEDI